MDGEPVAIRAGDTIGACLMRAGRLALRRPRQGGARGLYCGIGVCQDCVLTVDGEPGLRACVTAARPGQAVTTGSAG
ncbi:MAG: (2Fe-2S)-binding protein [Dongiaceae bacterium]